MADNVAVTPGTGATIATDEVSGAQYQVVKLALGASNAVDMHLDSGQQTMVNSVPVAIASDQGAVPVTLTTLTTLTGGGVADNGVDSGNPVKVGGRYNASAPTYGDGDRADLQTTVNGYLKVSLADLAGGEDLTNNTQGVTPKVPVASTYSPSTYTNFGAATKANIKASAGNVVSFSVYNANAAVRYFQLHNKASAPAAAEVPIVSLTVLPGTVREIGTEFFTQAGKHFATGVGFAWSTTAGTFTDSATAAEHNLNINYF